MNYLETVGKNAKKAFEDLKDVKHKKIKKVLDNYNQSLLKNSNKIIRENLKDVKNVKRKHLVDRLILNKKRIEGIRHSINEIAKFKDPVGRVLETWRRPNNLTIKRVTTPIGVIGVIYESRPNVTADVAALCLKSGNCSILRGGSEAFNSNKLLANLFRENLKKNNINQNCVQFIENKNRKVVDQLLSKMSAYIDVIVPRGGKGLVAKVQKFSNVHVIGHLEGLCHIYVDKTANIKMARDLIINAKMRRTSICGALETLLIDEKALNSHGKIIIKSLISSGCEVRVDRKINKLFKNNNVLLYNHFGSLEFENLLSKVRYLTKAMKCEYIILDHISIVVSGLNTGDERRSIDNVMTGLRSLVEETGAGLILVSHLKRSANEKGHEEGGQTSLSHLRGSAGIAQLSDLVIGLERNQQSTDKNNQTTVRVLKNRFSGETGVACKLNYDPTTGRLTEFHNEF